MFTPAKHAFCRVKCWFAEWDVVGCANGFIAHRGDDVIGVQDKSFCTPYLAIAPYAGYNMSTVIPLNQLESLREDLN